MKHHQYQEITLMSHSGDPLPLCKTKEVLKKYHVKTSVKYSLILCI